VVVVFPKLHEPSDPSISPRASLMRLFTAWTPASSRKVFDERADCDVVNTRSFPADWVWKHAKLLGGSFVSVPGYNTNAA
jgi:hypothetical protein